MLGTKSDHGQIFRLKWRDDNNNNGTVNNLRLGFLYGKVERQIHGKG